MERDLWIPTWRGDRYFSTVSREFVAGPGHPAPARRPPASGPAAVRPVAQPATDLREAVVLSVTRRSQERPGFCLTGIRSRNIRSPL